jgi:hypothetical protein
MWQLLYRLQTIKNIKIPIIIFLCYLFISLKYSSVYFLSTCHCIVSSIYCVSVSTHQFPLQCWFSYFIQIACYKIQHTIFMSITLIKPDSLQQKSYDEESKNRFVFQKEIRWCWKRWKCYILMAVIPNFLV